MDSAEHSGTKGDRVARHTKASVNERIRKKTNDSIRYYAGRPEQIDRRLKELEAEWDIERKLETNASVLVLVGLGLGAFVSRKWLVLPGIVAAFLFQHAAQGWCPPMPIFRRLGTRTKEEIMRERYALRILRGDFNMVEETQRHNMEEHVHQVIHSVNEKERIEHGTQA